jgi:phage-related minor tail protein
VVGSGLRNELEGRAAGGPVTAGTPYLVGERGPEIVVPGRSGTVIPNNRIGVGGGINVAIYPKTLPTDRELIDLVTNLRRRNGGVI